MSGDGNKVKRIEILGPGCAKCQQLAAAAEEAARELGLQYELAKVTEIDKIIQYGVMMTPALVVDGVVKDYGRVPTRDELKRMLAN
ncbi:MAG: thioredoxin family protein [Acidobacteriota bacterium]